MLAVSPTIYLFTFSFIKLFGLLPKTKDVMALLEIKLREYQKCASHVAI